MRWLLLVAACAPAYTAGTIPHATELPCLDVGARAVAEGSHVELTWAFGNRCDRKVTVALAAIHVDALDTEGRPITLEPRDPPPGPLPLGAGDHGVESFRYDADADIGSLVIEVGGIDADAPSEHRITIKPEPRPPQNDEELAPKKPKRGAWALRDATVTDAVELGTRVVAATPDTPVITHADGTRAQVGASGRLVGAGIIARALRSPARYLTVGVEILPGIVLGPRATTIPVDGATTTVKSASIGHGLVFADLHTTGDLQIGLELAAGVSSLAPTYGVPATDTVAPAAVFGLTAEARAQLRWWATRAITVTLSGGRSIAGDLDAGVDIGVHFLPYDGR